MDFLYFDVKPYVRGGPRVFQLAINALDASGGSNTAIERDLFAPLRQLVLAGEAWDPTTVQTCSKNAVHCKKHSKVHIFSTCFLIAYYITCHVALHVLIIHACEEDGEVDFRPTAQKIEASATRAESI